MAHKISSLILMVLVFEAGQLMAQRHIELAVKGGISLPNLTAGTDKTPTSTGYSSRLGPAAALETEWFMGSHFSLAVQLEYSAQGGKKNGVQAFSVPDNIKPMFPGVPPPYLYANYKSVARINYLMLPVMAKYHFSLKRKWEAYLSAGPFVSVLLSAKNISTGNSDIYLDPELKQAISSQPASFDHTENVRGALHKFNTGISGNIGVSVLAGKGRIFAEAGGNYGLVDIQKGNANGKNRTGAAVVSTGYKFWVTRQHKVKHEQESHCNDRHSKCHLQ